MSRIIFTNNTGADIRDFEQIFIDCVNSGLPLPEEIADLFTLEIIYVDGFPRGILNFA